MIIKIKVSSCFIAFFVDTLPFLTVVRSVLSDMTSTESPMDMYSPSDIDSNQVSMLTSLFILSVLFFLVIDVLRPV